MPELCPDDIVLDEPAPVAACGEFAPAAAPPPLPALPAVVAPAWPEAAVAAPTPAAVVVPAWPGVAVAAPLPPAAALAAPV